jgi:hypothetical protein
MTNAIKKAAAGPQSFDDFQRAEAATKARVDSDAAKLGQLEARYANPEPSDTPESLAQLEKAIAEAKRAVHLAKANHDRAVAAREAAEAELMLAEDRRKRAILNVA